MGFLSGNNNVVLVSQCASLQGLTVTLQVTEDLVTVGNSGFGLQLNCFPLAGQVFQNQTLNWFQYVIVIGGANGALPANDQKVGWAIEYWNTIGPANWPPGYTPNPPNTTPTRPVIPNDSTVASFADAPSNQILAGSILQVQLTTDVNGNITLATFNYTDPNGILSTASYPFGSNVAFPIYGVQNVLVGPFDGNPTTFTSGAGTLTSTVTSGSLSVETTACGGYSEPGTAEDSNCIYGDVTPAKGATVTQSVAAVPMGISFDLNQSTFGEDEVETTPSWNPADYLQVTGFPNNALGLFSPSDLNSTGLSPRPAITIAMDASLNTSLTAAQISTIQNNLPVVNTFAPPVLAIDSSLATDYQTLLYPYNISFPNLNAFDALNAHQSAMVTLSAVLNVPVPTSGNTNNPPVTTTLVSVNCKATIELAKGEDPRMVDLNPASPLSYPPWLSYDLRIFTVKAGQSHHMFSVPSPADASLAVTYIRDVLDNLNHPNQITNGDTFDNALTQDEDASAVPFLPSQAGEPAQFAFAVARVRVKSNTTTATNPVRVFFRLFSAASTATSFAEVGTGEGAYRWGTNGTAGHKIPLLGIETSAGSLEYVTVPCFATDRVNLTAPADMNTQTDPPNVMPINTVANVEVDTYFGCWLDVNQTSKFLIPTPPSSQSQWDGPWTGTESLNGAIAVAPHQCLVAEIRYDDTPIANGADTSNSDKLAQRNIAWLGVQP
jgi:hypothetical protein